MTSTQPQQRQISAGRTPARRSVRFSLALADQAVVSGVSFLTSIAIGRLCGKPELGVYALGMSVVLLAIAAQQSLISAAHTVFSVRLEGRERQRYNGAIAVQLAALCLLITGGFACACLYSGIWTERAAVTAVLLSLMLACPFILLREFARRFEFARFHMWGAFTLDVAVAATQLSLLAVLAQAGLLSGAMALMAVGLACASAVGVWCWLNRSQFQLSREGLGDEFRRGWTFGRWVFGGQISIAMVGFAIQWITAWFIGEAAVGVYSACMILIMLANPVILGLQNMLSPSIAQALHDGGRRSVRRIVARSTAGLTLMMSAYVAVIVCCGDFIVSRIYGQAFAGNGLTIGLLGAGALASAIGVSSNHGLRAFERPELNFIASLLGLIAGVATAWIMVPTWGVAGAALGFAVSGTLNALLRVCSFVLVSRQPAGATTS